MKKAAKKDIEIKISVPKDSDKELISDLNKFAKVKQNKSGNARFCIIDDKELLLFLTDDKNVHKSYDCAVWLNAPYFVEYFSKLFNKEWNN